MPSSEDGGTAGVYPGGKPPEEMTVAELKVLAKSLGISGYNAMNKADLIKAVEAAGQEG